MRDVPVVIEVIGIADGKDRCKGRAKTCLGSCYEMHVHTPKGLCARAFSMLYPYMLAMRFAEATVFERKGPYIDLVCPDGDVTFRLTRRDG